jgi:hypothetical protein
VTEAENHAALEGASEREWAPCTQDDAERAEAGAWLRGVLGGVAEPADRDLVENSEGSALEHLLWLVGLDGYYRGRWPFTKLRSGFFADQWVGVVAEYALPDGAQGSLWTEGDTFTLALGKTVERLQGKAEAYYAAHPEARPKEDDAAP